MTFSIRFFNCSCNLLMGIYVLDKDDFFAYVPICVL